MATDMQQQALEKVRNANQRPNIELTGLKVRNEIDDFLGGTLLLIDFIEVVGKKKNLRSNTVFIDEKGKIEHQYGAEQLASLVKEHQVKHSIAGNRFDTILKEFFTVPAIIAIVITLVISYLVITGREFPEIFSNSLTLIIGYYFGSELSKKNL